jgi:hypothetical protein
MAEVVGGSVEEEDDEDASGSIDTAEYSAVFSEADEKDAEEFNAEGCAESAWPWVHR